MSVRQVDWWEVRRKATRASSIVLIGIAVSCALVGGLRIGEGDTMRGLADIIVGGFVGLSGFGSWQDNRP